MHKSIIQSVARSYISYTTVVIVSRADLENCSRFEKIDRLLIIKQLVSTMN